MNRHEGSKVQRKATEAYQQRFDEVLAALNTDPRLGLSQAELRARLEKYGRNELTVEKPAGVVIAVVMIVPAECGWASASSALP